MTEEQAGRQGFWFFLCICLLSLGLWAHFIDTPFSRVFGFADYISNENGRIAENHLRYGLAATKGDQIRNLELAQPAEWVHYNNHPATLDLLTAGVLYLTGSRDPWAKRLLSLLASLASLVLLAALSRGSGLSPWVVMTLFLALPLTLVHGLNLSYEPLALFWMLGLVFLAERGWVWRLLPLLWLGGLIDYPVLYMGPWFALVALWEARGRSWRPALLYSCALALTCLASVATHLLHVAWTMGGLQADSGQSWWDHILRSLQSRGHEPAVASFLQSQLGFFMASFTLPILILALLSLFSGPMRLFHLARSPRPSRAALAFLFAGSLHVLLFRAHAMVHDFWLAYYAPFMALAGAAFLARLPTAPARFLIVFSSILGLGMASRVWQERAAVPVRAVARDLDLMFDERVVLHSLLAPPGWALESYRGHPVLDAGDLLQQPFPAYLDRVGSLGYLGRPQRLFVPIADLKESWARDLDRVILPGVSLVEKKGVARSGGKAGQAAQAWRVYDLGPFLLDPGRSPYLMDKSRLLPGNGQKLSEGERRRLVDRARKFLVLRLFAPGTSIAYLDGREEEPEKFLGRWVRSGGEKALSAGGVVVAWPGTVWAERLRALRGVEAKLEPIQAAGKPAAVWVWRPQS